MATTIGYEYDTEAQVLGTADGYVTLSGTTQQFSSVIDCNGWLGFAVTVEVDFDGTPTDNVNVNLYRCRDATPTNPDDVGQVIAQLDKATDPNQRTFVIFGEARYNRIGVVQTGSTNSHDVRIYATKFRAVTA